jgi:hypothetical protein
MLYVVLKMCNKLSTNVLIRIEHQRISVSMFENTERKAEIYF